VTCIQFGYEETPSGLTVTCEDDGVGIPAPDKERIFGKGVGRHSGLGLFLVREILGITGLSILETGESGRGARFEIHIPQGNYRLRCTSERDVHEAALRTTDLRAPPTEQ